MSGTERLVVGPLVLRSKGEQRAYMDGYEAACRAALQAVDLPSLEDARRHLVDLVRVVEYARG